ncbi:MAG: hypothetical protein JSR76_04480, partial [Verrucomicrobia bacterium]|nr:hypothetical protein [Verrucomicrobiota bacterium]
MAAAAGLPVSASFVPPVGAGTPAAGDDSLGASMGNIPPLDGTRVVDLTATATPRAPTGLPADLEAFLVAQDSEKPIPINRQFFVDISKKDAETVRDLYIQKRTLFNQLETLAITEGPLQALAEASLAAERAFDANKDQSRIEALSVICDDTATALNAAGNPCHLKYINADKEIYKFFKQMAQKSASYDHQAVGSVAKIWAHLEKEKGDETSKTAWREFLVLFGDVDLSLSELRIVTIAPPAAAASPPSPPPPSAPTLASLALPLLPPASPPTHPATASSPSTPPPALTHAAPTAASPPPSPTAPTSPVSREGSPPRTATPPPSAPLATPSSPSAPPPGAPTLVSAASPSVSREGSPPRTATPPP